MPSQPVVPLPKGWSRHFKSSLLHAISLASMALTVVHGRHTRSRLHVDLERARGEIALLKEELAIKDARWGSVAVSPAAAFLGHSADAHPAGESGAGVVVRGGIEGVHGRRADDARVAATGG